MLQGKVIEDGWRDEGVKETLDLCLSCKGCKGDCPVNVDMATYKAEFLSHHWEGRLRPRSAYAFGWIDKWAQAASLAPGFVNLITQLPVLRSCSQTGRRHSARANDTGFRAGNISGVVQEKQRIIQAKRAASE